MRFQYGHELDDQRERELTQMTDMIIRLHHIRITTTVNELLTYLHTNALV